MDHKINVQEPWFTLIKKGIKTVEGRLNKGKFCNLKINDTITWNNSSDDIYKNLKSSQLAYKNLKSSHLNTINFVEIHFEKN